MPIHDLEFFSSTSFLFSTWIFNFLTSLLKIKTKPKVFFFTFSISFFFFGLHIYFFLNLEFCIFNRLFRILDLVFIQLNRFTPFGRMFVFSISYFMMGIFCSQRNTIDVTCSLTLSFIDPSLLECVVWCGHPLVPGCWPKNIVGNLSSLCQIAHVP